MVTYDRDVTDFVERQPIGPETRTKMPAQLAVADLHRERVEDNSDGDDDDQHRDHRHLSRLPDDRGPERANGQTNHENCEPALRMTVGHNRDSGRLRDICRFATFAYAAKRAEPFGRVIRFPSRLSLPMAPDASVPLTLL